MNSEQMPNKFCDRIDGFIKLTGHVFMWANCILIGIIIVQVILRYVFGHGMVLLEELQWHFYCVAFMFGLSYALMTDSHVGMDIVYEKLSKNRQNLLDILGIIFLLLPFATLIFYQSLDFVHESWRLNERSVAPMGLPFRWAVKSVIPLGFGMLIIAAISRLIRIFSSMRRT